MLLKGDTVTPCIALRDWKGGNNIRDRSFARTSGKERELGKWPNEV